MKSTFNVNNYRHRVGTAEDLVGFELLTAWSLLPLLLSANYVHSHGRLIEPPSRASMWRYGYETPPDYHDNQLWCGGFTVQWEQNGGQCGVCGDVWNSTEPRDHELGGRYVRGIIVRRYQTSGTANVIVELTATHRGYFEFRMCPLDGLENGEDASWDCLNRYQLNIRGSNNKRYIVDDSLPMKHQMTVELPAGLECQHCVLQWKYNTGNSWGQDENGKSCLGCGPQEQFFGCADVSIGNVTIHAHSAKNLPSPTTADDNVTRPPETTTAFQLIHPTSPVQASASGKSATSSTIAAPTRRQHQSQQKRQGPMIQPSSATPHLLQPTTPAFPLALIASPNGAVASSAHDAATSGPNALPPVNRQPQQDDSIVERRHQTTFAGHPFTSVVYSRRNRLQSDADSVVNISHGDLLELEPNGSLYVVPAWYVIVNRGSRQLDIIEPKLLSEITSRVKSELRT